MWLEFSDELIDRSLARLRSALAHETFGPEQLSQARQASKLLELAMNLHRAEHNFAGRDAKETAAFLDLDGETDLALATRELARRIRSGSVRLDGPEAVRLHDLLLRGVVAKLRAIHPRYITARQRRAESSY